MNCGRRSLIRLFKIEKKTNNYDQDDVYEERIQMHDLPQQTVYAEVESSAGDLNTQWIGYRWFL